VSALSGQWPSASRPPPRGSGTASATPPLAGASTVPSASTVHLALTRLAEVTPGSPVLALASAPDERTAACLAARAAVACAARQPLRSVVVESRPGTAPAVLLPPGAPPFRVSVSHREGHAAAAAVSAAFSIGVDLERAGAVREKSARHFLQQQEARDGLRAHDLTALWALKEAAWKALLLDEAVPFAGLRMHFDARGALRRLELVGAGTCFKARSIVREPFLGFRLAVVVATPEEP